MNSESRPALEGMARRARAIVPCEGCHSYDVSAGDSDAERQAYALATEAWKRGEFGGSLREEVMDAMRDVLSDANISCPSCARERD